MARRFHLDQSGLERLATIIGQNLRRGAAILLEGPLGAGKSTAARALIRAACHAPELDVPSPSYTLVQTYETPALKLHHFDLWRLDGPDALFELGWDDATADVVLVEWPDRLGDLRPANALTMSIALAGENMRAIEIAGWEGRQALLF